jgi:hypothetical protein
MKKILVVFALLSFVGVGFAAEQDATATATDSGITPDKGIVRHHCRAGERFSHKLNTCVPKGKPATSAKQPPSSATLSASSDTSTSSDSSSTDTAAK